MNDQSITLKINGSNLKITNIKDLEQLKLPKELYEISLDVLEEHNRSANLLYKYSFLIISLFFTGFFLIFFLFQFIFFPSFVEYLWIFILLIIIGFGGSILFSESRKQTLIQRTLTKLEENSFDVLIINKQVQSIKMSNHKDESINVVYIYSH